LLKTAWQDLSSNRRLYLPLICGSYLVLFGILAGFIHTFPKEQMVEPLKTWVPWSLKINLLVLLVSTVLCYRDIHSALKQFYDRRGICLVALLILGFLLTCFVSERTHRIYFDEDIYANVGQNIALLNQTGFTNYGTYEYDEYFAHWIEYNKEPSGWPFLISLPFQLLGVDELYVFLLNNLLFVGGILLVFFIVWDLTQRYLASILAALVYTLIPHNIIWFNTMAAEPSAAFFGGLCAYAFIVYLRTREDRHLLVLAALIPMACQMRPESSLIFIWAMVAVLMFSPKVLGQKETWAIGLVATLFLLPHLLHFYAVSGYSWGAEGPKFAWSFFTENIVTNGPYYFNNREYPAFFTFLGLLGLLGSSRVDPRWRVLIFLWFLFFWTIFLFFYAGSYRYGADVRFALVTFMPLAVLAGMGGSVLRDQLARSLNGSTSTSLVVALAVALFIGFLPLVRLEGQEGWGARFDHKYARQFIDAIPRRSVILTQVPTMFLLWGQGAIQTYAGINHPDLIASLMAKYQGHVYFHYNFWCNAESKENAAMCQMIGERYNVEEIGLAREQHYEFGLYRLTLK
jgi:4-amino-4-deoxy-L-arabinose transferase-like glycosyltransferase